MGKYKLIFLSLIFLMTPHEVLADPSDMAHQWAKDHSRAFSEHFSQKKAKSDIHQFLWELDQLLLILEKKVQEARAEALDMLKKLQSKEGFEGASLFNLTLAARDALRACERLSATVSIFHQLSQKVSELKTYWLSISTKEFLTIRFKRPILNPADFIRNVAIYDGVNAIFSTDPGEFIKKGAKSLYESIFHIQKNREINRKMENARDTFNALQLTQAEYVRLLESELQLKKDFFENRLKTLQQVVDLQEHNLSKELEQANLHFSNLMDKQEGLLTEHHKQRYQNNLQVLEKKWIIEDLDLLKAKLHRYWFRLSYRQKR